MGQSLDAYDEIAIAQIVLYTLFLAGGIYLCIRHGFIKANGWRYTIILSLARLIGSGMRLGLLADPTNSSLYAGWVTTNSLGLAPLILILLGLYTRLFDGMKRTNGVALDPRVQRATELLMLVALIVVIVGGTRTDYTKAADGTLDVSYSAASKAGIAIMIVVMVIVFLEFLYAFMKRRYAAPGEHRILIAVGISIPFAIVRLVYSIVTVFGGSSLSVWVYLGTAVIMEIIVVLVCEVVGLTLAKVPPMPKEESDHDGHSERMATFARH